LRNNIGFIRDFARKSRFGKEGGTLFASCESFDRDEIEEGRGLALLAYVPFFCFIPFIQGRSANRFAYEHGKQGVLLFIFEIIALLGAFFWKAALFLAAVVAIVGMVYVIDGKLWRIPWIGPLAEKLDNSPTDEEES